MNKTRLAEEAGLSVRSITAFEGGEDAPSETTLVRLAGVLKFPVEFFHLPELEELAEESASFRALKRMTAGQRDSVLSAGRIAVELSRWISNRFALPSHDIADMRNTEPEAAAQALRTRWGLGEQPVPNMIHLLESKGVRVFSLCEECAEVDAFSLWWKGTPFIFLNTFKSGEHSRFDAAHELGHLVLHRHGPPQGPELEREADAFASAFLMPRARLLAQTPPVVNVETLIQLKRGWGVSVAALAYRLHAIKRLSDWNYRQLVIEISKRGYRTKEPNGIQRESSQILDKVFDALGKQGIRRTDVAKEVGITVSELGSLIFGLVAAPSSVGGERRPLDSSSAPPPKFRLLGGGASLPEGGESR
jgi:Zn-dependent peptidase ImmA (M78 family)/DNA-binding XRE family transcriptional regulator